MSEMHKVMGFGLQRVTPTALNYDGYLGYEHGFGAKGFGDFLERKDAEAFAHEIEALNDTYVDFSLCVHYTTKYLSVTPPHMLGQWHRMGDVFDKVESEIDGGCTGVQMLPHGIPGYRYLRDQQTGRKISGTYSTMFFDLYDKYAGERCDAVKIGMEGTLADLASIMGYGTIDDAVRGAVPYVPEIVKQFCYYLNLFRDDAQAEQLKPMLCVFWR